MLLRLHILCSTVSKVAANISISRSTDTPVLNVPQVYFVDDITDREWKVVHLKEARSRRVVEADNDDNLSASGPVNATRLIHRDQQDAAHSSRPRGESVLPAAVAEGTAGGGGSDEDDEESGDDFEEDEEDAPIEESEVPAARSLQRAINQITQAEDFDAL